MEKPAPPSSENRANLDSLKIKGRTVKVMFWNVENLYDPYNDTLKIDEEFTPVGMKHWTWTRLRVKLNHTAKTILAAGGWQPPVLIGLCEIENRFVLDRLVRDTPLVRWKYGYIHHDSPDARGVDVALLYRPDKVSILSTRLLTVRFPFDTAARTRDILVVRCLLNSRDTLVVTVNHWPSRRGGQATSQPRRAHAASVLRGYLDSVVHAGNQTQVLVMGDLNDEPEDVSIAQVLRAADHAAPLRDTLLYNLMAMRKQRKKEGTLKFRDGWFTFDQFIVSGSLLTGEQGLMTRPEEVQIYYPDFLLEEDAAYMGKRLRRTYAGPQYRGGFSDHLPILLELLRK